mmetsp:Transcript_26421/g.54104  ORF Transcript_26421/g.54104 Transcript_26421/m.54104 type:complete len:84 (+) Transcript_26421:277-528(+)
MEAKINLFPPLFHLYIAHTTFAKCNLVSWTKISKSQNNESQLSLDMYVCAQWNLLEFNVKLWSILKKYQVTSMRSSFATKSKS